MIKKSLIILLIISCAIEKPMTGGPDDSISPKIIQSIPLRDSLNFIDAKNFYFRFSERVDRRSFEQSVYLLPFKTYKKHFHWNGWDEVELEIDSLSNNKTYQLVIAKGFKDLHGVESQSEYRWVFSGQKSFDSLALQANFKFRKKYPQLRIALFETNDLSKLPTYIADLDSLNSIQLRYLKDQFYHIYLFNDENKNFKADLDKEEISYLDYQSNLYFNQDLELQLLDTLAPILKSVDSLFDKRIRLQFNEEIDWSKSSFYLTDTMGNAILAKKILSDGLASYLAYFPEMQKSKNYRLILDSISDFSANNRDSIREKLRFTSAVSLDSNRLKLKSTSIADSTYLKKFPKDIAFNFNKSIFFTDSVSAFLESAKKSETLKFHQINDKSLNFSLENKLMAGQTYTIHAHLKKMIDFDNNQSKDSVVKIRIFTDPANSFGTILFAVKTNNLKNLRYRLQSVADKNERNEDTVQIKNTIAHLKSGKYLLDIYRDTNGNKKYDALNWRPLQIHEPLYFYPDTIRIRANWDRELKEINLDDSF